ncbi:MAG: GLUG motif-containing protein [Dehalococcoidia bacterium]
MNKFIAVIITAAILVSTLLGGLIALLPQEAAAAPGDSPADPILITDLAGLQDMNSNLAAHYALDANIDLSGIDHNTWNGGNGFLPIGDSTTKFTGSFDGRGFSITGLFINRSDTNYVGLFGYIDSGSSVGNVSLASVNITGQQRVGGLVGYNNQGTIINSSAAGTVNGSGDYVGGLVGRNEDGTVNNSSATCNVSGQADVGGLVGLILNGTVNNSHATGTVNGTQDCVGGLAGRNYGMVNNSYATGTVNGNSNVGGLVGQNYQGTVNNSYATGAVASTVNCVGGLVGQNYYGTVNNSYATGTVNGNSYVGGLVGYRYQGTVNNSYATGTVSGTGDYAVGGLAGYNGGTVSNCYATGNVAGKRRAGGLVGWQDSYTVSNSYATGSVNCPDETGGLVGYSEGGTVNNSYATGAVNGSTEVGGLVGLKDGGTVNNSYAIGKVSGVTDIGGLVGKQSSGTVTASFYDRETTGRDDTGKGEPKTTAEMKNIATFTGWDIQGNATNNINNGYPFLSWQIPGNSPVWYIYSGTSPTPTPTPTPTPSPTPTPTSTPVPQYDSYYGGGGDSGWMPPTAGLFVLGQGDRWELSSAGFFLDDAVVSSGDGSVTVSIPANTQALGANGLPVTEITVNLIDPPPAPEGMHILAAFSFQPSGATFSPGIEITIAFDPSEVGEGETVAIAFFNEATQSWEIVEGTVSGGTATFTIDHFTVFAVLAGPSEQAPGDEPTPTPAATNAPPAASVDESGGLSAATWVGIAVGIILVILIAILLFRRRMVNY